MFMFTSENIDRNNIYLRGLHLQGFIFPICKVGVKKSGDPLIPFLKGCKGQACENSKLFAGFIVPAVSWSSLLIQGNDKAHWCEVGQHSRVFVGFCFVLNCICSNSNNFLIPSCRKSS